MKPDFYRGLSIKVCTRSMNLALYLKSMSLLDFKIKKRFVDRSSDQYIFDILNEDVDIIINIDEDAFLCDKEALFSLIDYVIDNKIVNCGMRDGGVLPIRAHHPLVTNPFFNILFVKKIRKKLNLDHIENIPFFIPEYKKLVPDNLSCDYEFDDFEPYYKIFIWIALNFKTLYLEGLVHRDGISTALLNQDQKPFLFHSWYSREYNKDKFHTERINSLYVESKTTNSTSNGIISLFNLKLIFSAIIKRIKNLI